jgi:hypothetical protein
MMRRRNSQNLSAAGEAAADKGFPAFAQNAKEHCGKARWETQAVPSGAFLICRRKTTPCLQVFL